AAGVSSSPASTGSSFGDKPEAVDLARDRCVSALLPSSRRRSGRPALWAECDRGWVLSAAILWSPSRIAVLRGGAVPQRCHGSLDLADARFWNSGRTAALVIQSASAGDFDSPARLGVLSWAGQLVGGR